MTEEQASELWQLARQIEPERNETFWHLLRLWFSSHKSKTFRGQDVIFRVAKSVGERIECGQVVLVWREHERKTESNWYHEY